MYHGESSRSSPFLSFSSLYILLVTVAIGGISACSSIAENFLYNIDNIFSDILIHIFKFINIFNFFRVLYSREKQDMYNCKGVPKI